MNKDIIETVVERIKKYRSLYEQSEMAVRDFGQARLLMQNTIELFQGEKDEVTSIQVNIQGRKS